MHSAATWMFLNILCLKISILYIYASCVTNWSLEETEVIHNSLHEKQWLEQ